MSVNDLEYRLLIRIRQCLNTTNGNIAILFERREGSYLLRELGKFEKVG